MGEQTIRLNAVGVDRWARDSKARATLAQLSKDLGYSALRVEGPAGEVVAWYPLC